MRNICSTRDNKKKKDKSHTRMTESTQHQFVGLLKTNKYIRTEWLYDFPNVHPVDKNTMYRMCIPLALYEPYQASWIFNFIKLIWRARYRGNKAVYIVPAENNVSLRYLIDLMIHSYIIPISYIAASKMCSSHALQRCTLIMFLIWLRYAVSRLLFVLSWIINPMRLSLNY